MKSSNLPTILIGLALSMVLGSNLLDQRRANGELVKAIEQQTKALAEGKKIETQLDALAKGTNGLALSGNANAQRIVATLKQNGISIK